MLLILILFLVFVPWVFAVGYTLVRMGSLWIDLVFFQYSFGIFTQGESAKRRIECVTLLMLLTPWLHFWCQSFAAYYHGKEDFSPTTFAYWSFLVIFGYACVTKIILCNAEDERLDHLERMIRGRIAKAAWLSSLYFTMKFWILGSFTGISTSSSLCPQPGRWHFIEWAFLIVGDLQIAPIGSIQHFVETTVVCYLLNVPSWKEAWFRWRGQWIYSAPYPTIRQMNQNRSKDSEAASEFSSDESGLIWESVQID